MKRKILIAVAVMVAAITGCGGQGKPGVWRPKYSPFAKDSPLRVPLPRNVKVHRHSIQMIADLYGNCPEKRTGSCKFPRLAGAPEDGFFSDYGTPVYLAIASTRTRTVPCKRFACGVQGIRGEDTKALFDVPIPPGARPESSDDHHMVVYDPVRGYAWEMFGASYSVGTDHWKMQGGIRWDLKGPGYDEVGEPGTAVGAGVPLLGTILRPEEVRRAMQDGTGVVPHVLSGGYDSPRKGCYIGPLAKTTDGDDGRTWSIPEGAILQLDPTIDLDKLDLGPAERVIARTLQQYGMVIRDDTGAFAIDVENVSVEDGPHPGRSKLWGSLGVHKDSLAAIQGNMFRVVAWDSTQAHGPNCV